MTVPEFSNLIVYVDESRNHGAVSSEFPLFVLAFCVFDKGEYANTATSLIHRLKFKHFGHDGVVLHERDIRMSKPPFHILLNPTRREVFMADTTSLIERTPFELVGAVIDKPKLRERYPVPKDPYHLALQFGLERLQRIRQERNDTGKLHVIFESRNSTDNAELELEFFRLCAEGLEGVPFDFVPIFCKKAANHCGLQIADLVARPIARHVMDPTQSNRAFDTVTPKFRSSPTGEIAGWGLKCFP